MPPAEQDPGAKYEVRHQIGRGSFGSAFLVTNKQDRADYVLKRVRLAKQTKWQRNSTLQERDLATSLRHPFIVPCVESWVVQHHTVNMIYAFCQNGDLAGYLAKVRKQGSQIDEGLMQKWLCQLLLALDYLQTQHVLHRDIKTSNLLLTAEDDVQLGDFGLATLMEEHGDERKPQDTNLVGTPHYMSPELLSCKSYGFKTDVWSLGCVFYELTAQRPTFNAFNIHGLVSKIKKNKLTPLPSSYSSEWRDIVELMLCKNPDRRPSVQQIMGLPALRPAMLAARARARQLMPTVQLPPLLDPTPLTPQPLLRQYRLSSGQDVADESDGSGGGMSDQQGCGCSAGGSEAEGASSSSRPTGDRRRAPSAGLTPVQALQASELTQLWKANFGQLQQQEECQRDDTESPEQQSAADEELMILQQHQQQRELQEREEQLRRRPSRGHSRPGPSSLQPVGGSGSYDTASSSGCCSPIGSHSSSPTAHAALAAAEGRGGGGLGAGYSPRGASNVIDGYKRIVTPRMLRVGQQQQQQQQPDIKRTTAERVAAAGMVGPQPTTGRLTPDLCPRSPSNLSPAGSSRAQRSSGSGSMRSASASLAAQQQQQQTDSAEDSPPHPAAMSSSSSSSSRRVPSNLAKQRPVDNGHRQPAATSCAASAMSPSPRLRPDADVADPAADAAAIMRGEAATAAACRPLSAPRVAAVRRMSDRGPQGGGADSPKRPPWGSGGGSRPCLTPGRQRPAEPSPLIKAIKPHNTAAAAAGAAAAAAMDVAEAEAGTAAAAAAADSAASAGRKQRRSHGQLSPVGSNELTGDSGCAATSTECAAHYGTPGDQQQQQQDRGCSTAAAAAATQQVAVAAGARRQRVEHSIAPLHGLPRRASYTCPTSADQQHQVQQVSGSPARQQGVSSLEQRRSAPGTANLPPLPLHKLHRAGNKGNSPQLSPLQMASPVHGKDRPVSATHSGSSSSADRRGVQHAKPPLSAGPLSGRRSSTHAAAGGQEQQPASAPAVQPLHPTMQPDTSQHDVGSSRRLSQEQQAYAAVEQTSNSSSSSYGSKLAGSPMQRGQVAATQARGSAHSTGATSNTSGSTSRRDSSSTSSASTTNASPDDAQSPDAAVSERAGGSSNKRSGRPTYGCNTTPKRERQSGQREKQPPPLQQQQHQCDPSSSRLDPQQMVQRLELLESAMMVIGGLVERKRWTELSTVMQSAGLLPDGLEQLDLQESTGSGSPGRHNHHHQPRASDVLKLGDIVVLGSSRSIRGQIRYIGPVAWDPSAADWVGMELDRPCGVDATQRGLTYFECQPDCASFHRASDLTSLGA